ncbi:hypothetical protein G647_01147 [Cladophialophora carrionii CBS 160.54]|uniref:Helicase C-terminal domain-containing protein n=1 Tax=Cladophialophora carrionii CBS 160.54 TaxID=1279043 RepID=V9DPV3_9EURO|nr:uncharacterized protein G647_01147 [Cladophialophora carrionii CBS 160.54]ETI28696.1 hypothetical protein G647_01147 [Cladophialophora carrionii CBS 160.54]
MDDYLAFGTIRLVRQSDHGEHAAWRMVGPKNPIHPHPELTKGEARGWIRTTFLPHVDDPTYASLKVHVLPEDVNRSSRGSIQHLRKLLKLLADLIDTSVEAWNGSFDPNSPMQTYKEPDFSQEESLFYTFNTLSSPQITLGDAGTRVHDQQAMGDVFQDSIIGLKTQLYPYQKRSVAAMLQKEVHPSKSRDPRKPQFRDLNGTEFYFDVHEGVLLRHPHLYSECRGGILAETMGYGKTLICIALVLATRGHYPAIPEGRISAMPEEYNERTPSLLALAAKKIKQAGVPWKSHFAALETEGYHFDSCTAALAEYDGEYAEPIFHPTTPDRKNKKREDFRMLRQSFATLLIVPPNLLVQWQHEIKKHTHPGALDVLVLDSTTKDIPPWKSLMKYDIVLITKARFEQEYRDDHLNQGRQFKGSEKFRSQLTEVRWLRVICDEGHGFAGSSYKTHAVAMLDKMSIERRWVVSGTPSHSLQGVEVNLALNETNDNNEPSRDHSIRTALERRRAKEAADDELKDMERLRAIVVNFLKVQPWANQKGADYADWKKYLHPFDASQNRRFAPALKAILQSLIIRHRIEDIDVDLCLPPLHNTTVCLEPSYYDKLSMNLFRMVLTSNAVTSERVDDDYMFQPKNRKYLDELINNQRRSSFHWVGFTTHEVAETLRVSKKYLDEHLDTISDGDGALLTEAIMNGERALNDSGWRAFSFYHEIGVYVKDFPDAAAQAWALNGEPSNPLLLGTKQAREAQQHVLKHLESGDPSFGLVGAGIRAMFAARERATEEMKAREKARPSPNGKPPTAGTAEEPKIKNQAATFSSPVRSSKAETLLAAGHKRISSTMDAAVTASLAKPKVIGFTSAKLNYLCSRVLLLQRTEKIIIFYDSNNIAFWIAEALELLSVKFLIYANTLAVARRAAYLATFNQSGVFRVLLMDLKQASHGLHVAAATRIFIVSPIWQPDVESQAIKRAHRIGQTRPVYVETLVLKGTLEEKILKRRRQMSKAELVKAEKSLLDDDTMNGVIRGEGFLNITDDEKERMKGGTLDEPVPLFERRDGPFSTDGAEDSDLIVGLEIERARNKRRKTPAKRTRKDYDRGPERTVAFGATDTLPLSPPVTPAAQPRSSIFGGGNGIGSPVATARPKKAVGFMIETNTPPASGSDSSSGSAANHGASSGPGTGPGPGPSPGSGGMVT